MKAALFGGPADGKVMDISPELVRVGYLLILDPDPRPLNDDARMTERALGWPDPDPLPATRYVAVTICAPVIWPGAAQAPQPTILFMPDTPRSTP